MTTQTVTVQTTASFSVDDLFTILENGLPIARYLASLTATPWDDKAVDGLQAIIRSQPLRKWFADLLDVTGQGDLAGDPMKVVEAPKPAMLAAAAADAGMEKEEFIEYIPMILEIAKLVLTLFKNRKGGGRRGG